MNTQLIRHAEDAQDHLFRALSDRSRRKILRALAAGPLPVSELAIQIQDPTRVGYHLRVLRQAGAVIVRHERHHRATYEVAAPQILELERFLYEIAKERSAPSEIVTRSG